MQALPQIGHADMELQLLRDSAKTCSNRPHAALAVIIQQPVQNDTTRFYVPNPTTVTRTTVTILTASGPNK